MLVPVALLLLLQTVTAPSPDSLAAAQLRSLVTYLHLRADQQPAAKRYLAAANEQAPEADPAEVAKLDTPGYLAFLAKTLRVGADRAEAARREAVAFDAVLSPEQRALWTAQLPGHDTAAALAPEPVLQSHPDGSEAPHTAPPLMMIDFTPPHWVAQPTGRVLERLYPHDALGAGLSGSAVLRCATDLDGYLADCVVVQEEPPGAGFGNAALQATAWMRMSTAKLRGLPVRGVVTIPVSFKQGPQTPDPAPQ